MKNIEINMMSKYVSEDHQINNLSLTIEKGDLITIQCTPIEGKLIQDILTGLVKPTSGSIINTDNTKIIPIYDYGYDDNLTVSEVIHFYINILHSDLSTTELVDVFGLLSISNQRIDKLTKTQLVFLGIAIAYIRQADIIIIRDTQAMNEKHVHVALQHITSYLRKNAIGAVLLTASQDAATHIGDKFYRLSENGLINLTHNEKSAPGFILEKIPVKTENKIILLNPSEIYYIEALNNNTCIYTERDKYVCNLTMSQTETRLSQLGFFRNHRSYLVNLQKISEVIIWSKNTYSLVLDNKDKSTIPISKARLDQLKTLVNF
jgi:ABC-2 type transport system ATP-binding protein